MDQKRKKNTFTAKFRELSKRMERDKRKAEKDYSRRRKEYFRGVYSDLKRAYREDKRKDDMLKRKRAFFMARAQRQ